MRAYLSAVLVVLLAAFAAPAVAKEKQMVPADAPGKPPPDKALVVFIRPGVYVGSAITSSVYDVTGGRIEFIGIAKTKMQIAYLVDPGERLFMVIAENADFMDAKLEGGKTYYALISPRMGMWKARFSLLPVRTDRNALHNVHSKDYAEWVRESAWVKRGAGADAWYAKNKDSVAKKYKKFLPKWNERSDEERKNQLLRPEDGV